jgi:hypothetical protein
MANEFEGIKSAAETAKQIIARSTGVVALTVTFLEKLVTKDNAGQIPVPGSLKFAWVCYGVSLLFGLLTLMSITGVANRSARDGSVPDAMQGNIVFFGVVMVVAFLLGIVLTIRTGFQLFG